MIGSYSIALSIINSSIELSNKLCALSAFNDSIFYNDLIILSTISIVGSIP